MGPVRGCCGVPFRRRMFCGGCSWVKRQQSVCPGWSDGRLGGCSILVRGDGGLLHTIGVLREHEDSWCFVPVVVSLWCWLVSACLCSFGCWGVGVGRCVLFENCMWMRASTRDGGTFVCRCLCCGAAISKWFFVSIYVFASTFMCRLFGRGVGVISGIKRSVDALVPGADEGRGRLR